MIGFRARRRRTAEAMAAHSAAFAAARVRMAAPTVGAVPAALAVIRGRRTAADAELAAVTRAVLHVLDDLTASP